VLRLGLGLVSGLRIFEVVKCGQILRILSADVWVQCGCENADVPSMSVCLLPTLIALRFKHTVAVLSYMGRLITLTQTFS